MRIVKAIVIFLLLIGVLIIWFDQSRRYYCTPSCHCVTVWKRIGNRCHVIPGIYKMPWLPKKEYIETTNTQSLSLYFPKSKPENIVVMSLVKLLNQDSFRI